MTCHSRYTIRILREECYIDMVYCNIAIVIDTGSVELKLSDITKFQFFSIILLIFNFSIDGGKEVFNKTAGHLLRTKGIHHNDGGVDAGRAVLDTPLLMP